MQYVLINIFRNLLPHQVARGVYRIFEAMREIVITEIAMTISMPPRLAPLRTAPLSRSRATANQGWCSGFRREKQLYF